MTTRWATLYKYVRLEHVERILDSNCLYLSDGTDFNDPFEVTITDRAQKTVSHIEGLHILSLTNSYKNNLIWSHYTNSHKGVCLTVQVPNILVYPICYTKERVYLDSNIDKILSEGKIKSKSNVDSSYSYLSNAKKIAYIKDENWMYENEYRIVFDKQDEDGLVFENHKWFMPVKITNIYLGVNFFKNDIGLQKQIFDACYRNKIKIAKVVLSENGYSLKIERAPQYVHLQM